MKVTDLYRGLPHPLTSRKKFTSSIARIRQDELIIYEDRIEGDDVQDKVHHGGLNRVLHHFPKEHYSLFKSSYPQTNFTFGHYGENLSSTYYNEENVCIGDLFQIGEIECIVTEPRKPCGTIDVQFQTKGLARMIQNQAITGWFYKITKPGKIIIGDEIKLLNRSYPELTIKKCVQALLVTPNLSLLEKMASNPCLSDNWKNPALKYLATNHKEDDSSRLNDT
jgi:MOSC domain-containing protein YiiM